MTAKELKNLSWRLRRLELALKFRVKQYEIKPTKRFLQNFPRLRERKFYLVSWTDDKRIKVLVSGTKNPHYYHYQYFHL